FPPQRVLVVDTAAVLCHVLPAVCTAVSLAADILLAAPLHVLLEVGNYAAVAVGRNYRVAGSVVCYASVCLLLANRRADLRGSGVLTDSHRRSTWALP